MTFSTGFEPANSDYDSSAVNVGDTERLASIVGGGLVLFSLLRYGRLSGMLGTLLGAGLIYRGMTGHCHMYEALDMNTNEECDEASEEDLRLYDDCQQQTVVEIASDDSFPASDPPAWTGAAT